MDSTGRTTQAFIVVAIFAVIGVATYASYRIFHPAKTVQPDSGSTSSVTNELRSVFGPVSNVAIPNTNAGYYAASERERITRKTILSGAAPTNQFVKTLESKNRDVRAFLSVTAFSSDHDATGEYLFVKNNYGLQAVDLFGTQSNGRIGSFDTLGIENSYYNYASTDAKETRDWTVVAHDSNITLTWIFRLPVGQGLEDLKRVMSAWAPKLQTYKSAHPGLICRID
jgi:hypothetical protein